MQEAGRAALAVPDREQRDREKQSATDRGGASTPAADHQSAFSRPRGRSTQFRALLVKIEALGKRQRAPASAEKRP
eukprot:5099748-Alexandrium_andersonii.AAC.1